MKRFYCPEAFNLRPLIYENNLPAIFRTGTLEYVSYEKAVEFIDQYGIKIYIDLKNTPNNSSVIGKLKTHINYIHLPLLGIDRTKDSQFKRLTEDEYARQYFEILEKNGPQIKEFFRLLFYYDCSGIVFGCLAGKDRTGVISYLLLSLAECPTELIVKDYISTNRYLKTQGDLLRERWLKRGIRKEEYLTAILAKEKTLRLLDVSFKNKYGTSYAYLKAIKVEEVIITAVRERLKSNLPAV